MRYTRHIASTLVLALVLSACGGGGFANDLRLTLALAPPLIDSLIASGAIPASARTTYIKDFTDLADGALSLKENLNSCKTDVAPNACRIGAIGIYQQVFVDIVARGHLGHVTKLHTIEVIIQGIINAARIYYGASSTHAGGVSPAKSIQQGMDDLKRAMQVKGE